MHSTKAVGLTEEFRANNVRPYRFPSLKMGNRLLCPIGHFLYRGDDYAKPPLLEEVASRRLDGGVMHSTKTPHPFPMKRPKSQQPFGGDAAMIGK